MEIKMRLSNYEKLEIIFFIIIEFFVIKLGLS